MEFYIWKNGFAHSVVGLTNAAAVVILGLAGLLIVAYLRPRQRPLDGGDGIR